MKLTKPGETTESDWVRYQAFLAVLEGGSLSAAARALGLAQPTVRRRIEELERRIATTLFTRSPAGLLPTSLARELALPARAMAAAAEAFARTASAEAGAASGVVRVTASEVIGVEVLPPILAALQARHAGMVIELGTVNRNEDLLLREADIAVRMLRPTQEALVARRVGVARLGLFAHRRLLDLHGQPQSVAALRSLPLVGFEHEPSAVRDLRRQVLGLRREDFTFRSDSHLAQLAAIRAGAGAGFCQMALARRTPELVQLFANTIAYDLEIWLAMHEDLRPVRRVRLVFDHLAQALAAYTTPR